MPFLELDIRTILRLLVIGNLVAMVMVLAYKGRDSHAVPLRLFVLGKVFEASAWALLSMRGEIPFGLSAHLGNALIFFGFYFEIAALGRLFHYRLYLERLLAVWAVAGAVIVWNFGTTPALMVVTAATVHGGICGIGGWALLWSEKVSLLRWITAVLFLMCCPLLLFKAYYAFTEASTLLTISKNQSVVFMTLFSLLLVGLIGFLLLMKEVDDCLLQESESRERERSILKSRFIDMLSHELRASLSAIKLSGSSLQLQLSDQPKEVSRRLTNISRAVDSMNDIIDRCIEIDKLEHGEPSVVLTECYPRDIVAALCAFYDPNGERIRNAISVEASLFADRKLLGVMLENLIDNARKYSSPNTLILIYSSSELIEGKLFGRIFVENFAPPGMMPTEERIFVRYSRGMKAHEFSGTGLGLYLVRTFARLQGGDAECQTDLEGKVLINVRLPSGASNRLAT